MSEDLKNFKENFIFEKEKDKSLVNAKVFKLRCETEYSYTNVFNIYKRIIDYQIKKYGGTLENNIKREYNKDFYISSNKRRKNRIISTTNNQKQERFIEKIEKLQGGK